MWMWHLDHELEEWFDALDAERSRGGAGPEDDDEDVPMMRNALVRR